MGESDLDLVENKPEVNLAKTAAKYIYSATLSYPGCAAAEGVEIARLCQKFKKDPVVLKTELLNDEPQIDWLIEEGNKHHPLNGIKSVVMRPRMVAMIEGIFDFARDVMGNTPEEIANALEQYPKYQLDGLYDEVNYGDEVMSGLTAARAERVR